MMKIDPIKISKLWSNGSGHNSKLRAFDYMNSYHKKDHTKDNILFNVKVIKLLCTHTTS